MQLASPLFDSGATLSVQAGGSDAAGFAAFEQSFTATTLLTTTLREIGWPTVFGQDDLTVAWTPAADRIALSFALVLGAGSVALNCDADDAAGSFTLPRSAIVEAAAGQELLALSVSVTRIRTEFYEGFATRGMLSRS